MRISDRAVFQEVDNGLYVIAADGQEVRLDADEVARFHIGISRAFIGRDRFITEAYRRLAAVADVTLLAAAMTPR
jgi:hypothetical protein